MSGFSEAAAAERPLAGSRSCETSGLRKESSSVNIAGLEGEETLWETLLPSNTLPVTVEWPVSTNLPWEAIPIVPTTLVGPTMRRLVGEPKVRTAKFLMPSPPSALSSAVHNALARLGSIPSSKTMTQTAAVKRYLYTAAPHFFEFCRINATIAPLTLIIVDELQQEYFKFCMDVSTIILVKYLMFQLSLFTFDVTSLALQPLIQLRRPETYSL